MHSKDTASAQIPLRAVACIVDLVIVFAIGFVINSLTATQDMPGAMILPVRHFAILGLTLTTIAIAYHAVCHLIQTQTIGKRIVDIEVISAHGRQLNLSKFLLRLTPFYLCAAAYIVALIMATPPSHEIHNVAGWTLYAPLVQQSQNPYPLYLFAKYLLFTPAVILMLEIVSLLQSLGSYALHDRIAGTTVVRAQNKDESP